ncbi:DUF1289 domain-containing protein [Teredinibacter franksiae]|uniref:DUF1289 domain-containing protein n=1 Tax=Teredinibacter franksiae TaxID=2761453 RepID=UPI0016298949|nr:DUF1289 domain-containing protein [Teredinibacter franksiae]
MPKNEVNSTENVQSPCIKNCCLDSDEVCLGCKRTLAEIVEWSACNNNEKNEILHRCELRKLSNGRT